MKPDVKRILTKLIENKVELSTEKIELAIADDIAKMVNEGKEGLKTLSTIKKRQERNNGQMIQNITQVIKTGDAEDDKINRVIEKLEKLPMKIANILEKAEKAAKEIGVAPNSIKSYKEADRLYENLESGLKEANSFTYTDLERFVK
tara:strand:- start:295 stop:735 length:441 start_codon:yes stop_codon:yes gene_type:complete